MGLHHLVLLCRKPSRLVQDFGRNGDLTDIVQRRGHGDHIDILVGQLIFVRFPKQAFQQKFRNRLDMQHVKAAFPIPEFHDMAQDRNHKAGILLFLKHLVRDHLDELPLLCVKHDGIDHPSLYNQRIKRTADIVRNAQLISPLYIGRHALCGNHDHRHIFDPLLLIHDRQDFESVHLRHHNVQKDQ